MARSERISAREAHQLMCEAGYVYLDVRSTPEFDSGHPEGAYNVPLLVNGVSGLEENPQFVAEVEAVLGKAHRLVVGCASGVRSRRAVELLRAASFVEVLEQRAGMDGLRDAFGRVQEKGYRAEGLPIALRAQPGRSYAEIRKAR